MQSRKKNFIQRREKYEITIFKNGRIQSLNLIFPHENFKASIIFNLSLLCENFKTSVNVSEYFLIALVVIFCGIVLFVRVETLCLASSWNSHFSLALSWLVYLSLSLLKLDKARI